MSRLSNLPYQLLVDDVLSELDVDGLLNLRQVSRSYQELADDDLVWRRKIAKDFVFPLQSTARTSGWRNLYKGLYNPELYTWGDYKDDRIGQRLAAETLPSRIWQIIVRARGVPFPLKINWKDAQKCQNGFEESSVADDNDARFESVVPLTQSFGAPIQIHAGGWSFYTLTGQGQILAWGSCSGSYEPVSTSEVTFVKPTLLDLNGKRAKTLTVGREHAIALLDDGSLIEWTRNWDRPVKMELTSHPTSAKHEAKVVQIEAGWDFTAVLTHTEVIGEDTGPTTKGESRIVLWRTKWTRVLRDQYLRPYLRSRDSSAKWMTPSLDMNTITLPAPPDKVIRIASGEDFVIALTEERLVYYIAIPSPGRHNEEALDNFVDRVIPDTLEDSDRSEIQRLIEESVSSIQNQFRTGSSQWQELRMFSSDLRSSGIRSDGSNAWDQEGLTHLINKDTKVTHISAHFRHFAVYAPDAGSKSEEMEQRGKGIVILGNKENINKALVVPGLQGIQVIKVTHGDWHSGALTLDGRVLTWGAKVNGALGVWDSLPVADNAPSTLQVANAADHQSTMPLGRFGLAARFRGIDNRQSPSPPTTSVPPYTQQSQSSSDREASDSTMVKAEKQRYKLRNQPEKIGHPLQVRLGFPRIGEDREGRKMMEDDAMETKYVFDIAFAGWHSGALAIDRSLMTQEENFPSMQLGDQQITM